MFNLFAPERDTERGFTLIELLIVIGIIGILSSIAIPSFMSQRASAANAALKSDIRSMAIEMETWQVKNRKAAGDIELNEGDLALNWTVISRHSPNTPFFEEFDTPTKHAPEGFHLPAISDGNAIGVVTEEHLMPNGAKGYCIIGANSGSYPAYNFSNKPAGQSVFNSSLFYDSTDGGLYESTELPENGACENYRARIEAGW